MSMGLGTPSPLDSRYGDLWSPIGRRGFQTTGIASTKRNPWLVGEIDCPAGLCFRLVCLTSSIQRNAESSTPFDHDWIFRDP